MKTVPCKTCKGKGTVIDQAALGENLRRVRIKHGSSLRNVADQMGISAPYLSDLELGRRRWSEALIDSYKRAIAFTMPMTNAK